MKSPHRWLGLLCLVPGVTLADAATLTRGDVSVSVAGVYEPFDQYWYYQGPDTLMPYDTGFVQGSDPSYLSTSHYRKEDLPGTVTLANTSLRLQYGASDRVTLGLESQLVSGSGLQSDGTCPFLGDEDCKSSGLGDTDLNVRYGLIQVPVMASVQVGATIPGSYQPGLIYAPGDGAGGLNLKMSVGGLTLKRKVFYDLGLTYQLTMPYRNAAEFEYRVPACDSPDLNGCGNDPPITVNTLIDGPSSETHLEVVGGYFINRRLMVYGNLNGVDSHSGVSWDDYRKSQDGYVCSEGGGCVPLTDEQKNTLLTELEEDYLRAGLGVMLRPQAGMTVFFNYNYTVWGKNTAANLAWNLPIGAIAAGVEFTWGTSDAEATPAKAAALDPRHILAMDLGGPDVQSTR